MRIGDRIKNRRIELNIAQTDLAQKARLTKQTIYKYENNIITNIPSDKIERIAEALNTTPAYLMGWENVDIPLTTFLAAQIKDSGTYIKSLNVNDHSGNEIIDFLQALAFYSNKEIDDLFNPDDSEITINGIPIPLNISLPSSPSKGVRINVFGSIPAGVPLEAIEDIVDWEDIPKEWTKGDQEYIGLRVKGDSMSPKYLDGDTVIIRLQPDCESGQDAAVYVNGYDATLKKVVKLENSILLQPLNPEYLPKEYDFNDESNPGVTILGVVVEIRRKV